MRDIMIDIETLSTGNDAVIVSLGAVMFDPLTGELGEEFYSIIDKASCLDIGLVTDPGTVEWWNKQSEEAKAILTSDEAVPIQEALQEFDKFYKRNGGGEKMFRSQPSIWGNGSNFDNVILRSAYVHANIKCPWHFVNDKDVRTLVDIGRRLKVDFDKNGNTREGVHHHALDDAKHQAKYCSQIYIGLNS
jgi:hypothetical protein